MRDSVDRILSIALTLAALAIAISVVRRSFFPAGTSLAGASSTKPDYIDTWKDVLPYALPLGGDDAAPVTIVELTDLQCPACRGFHEVLQQALAERPQSARALYVSYPLEYHQHALPAARGALCAQAAGAFQQWVDAIYAKQDSLGVKGWGSYAADAQIPDTAAISACASEEGIPADIERGLRFGSDIAITGTPTVLINGWRLPRTPSKHQLLTAIDAVANGKKPR